MCYKKQERRTAPARLGIFPRDQRLIDRLVSNSTVVICDAVSAPGVTFFFFFVKTTPGVTCELSQRQLWNMCLYTLHFTWVASACNGTRQPLHCGLVFIYLARYLLSLHTAWNRVDMDYAGWNWWKMVTPTACASKGLKKEAERQHNSQAWNVNTDTNAMVPASVHSSSWQQRQRPTVARQLSVSVTSLCKSSSFSAVNQRHPSRPGPCHASPSRGSNAADRDWRLCTSNFLS
jgi:hypothetical protein